MTEEEMQLQQQQMLEQQLAFAALDADRKEGPGSAKKAKPKGSGGNKGASSQAKSAREAGRASTPRRA